MLDSFIFENHLGIRFTGLENGVYLNYSELRDYSWSFETINDRISRFYRSVTSRKIPLLVSCASEDQAVEIKNRLMELAEVDIEARLPGKVYVGDYYTTGYITASKKGSYLISDRLCQIELTWTSDDSTWYCEDKNTFVPEPVTGDGGSDYPYDYAYDYAKSMTGRGIICKGVGGSGFRLRIYGATINPVIIIGGHTYAISGAIGNGESLLIDSISKTITLTTAAGKQVNWFDNRSRESYIFEPIPPGQHPVSWPGTFGFDLTVIEKRSEPKWT